MEDPSPPNGGDVKDVPTSGAGSLPIGGQTE